MVWAEGGNWVVWNCKEGGKEDNHREDSRIVKLDVQRVGV